jgi:hypothetical protein
MSDRDSTMWTIWWTSEDGQGSMCGGNYPTREAALEARAAVEQEFMAACADDDQIRSIEAGSWDLQMPDEEAEMAGLRYSDRCERL